MVREEGMNWEDWTETGNRNKGIPRPEHPKPQFRRDSWMSLNGEWDFEVDNGQSGLDRGLYRADAALCDHICVPFCPQSELSGLGIRDFLYGMWYQRKVYLPPAQLSGNVFLHFGAVDHRCQVFVNGEKAGEHAGGYVSFRINITSFVRPGENVLTVYAQDDERDPMIPHGKQCAEYFSGGTRYTRTSGIWQSVWLEFVPKCHIDSFRIVPNVGESAFWLTAEVHGKGILRVQAFYEGRPVGEAAGEALGSQVRLTLSLAETHLWEPGHGRLYDLKLTFGEDTVYSYAGLRSVSTEGRKFLLNGESVFLRMVLDQGFYPDGIYTAPTEEALIQDIQLSMSCGFQGARLHEKVFEERFLYHCDRLGYMVWGEFPNWGLDHTRPESIHSVLPPWLEEIARDFNHPSIIGWCPFNETWDINGHRQCDDVIRDVYLATKSADSTRPCIDTSGNYHVLTDIYDVHDYDQNPETFKGHYDQLINGGELFDGVNHLPADPHGLKGDRQHYDGEKPIFFSEYGGIAYNVSEGGWGYGQAPATGEDFLKRFRGLTQALLSNPEIMGLCYTQLTDIEQEQNGLFTYHRQPKFPPEMLHEILSRKAAIED